MSKLIVKPLENLEEYKSYGGNSLAKNIENAESAIGKVQYTERIWDRSRSQFMLKFLTCSQADDWMRLRQISAEMAKKRVAYTEAKFSYVKKIVKIKIKRKKIENTKDDLEGELLEIQCGELEWGACELLVKVEGALKEIQTLGYMHDKLSASLGEITEEAFEKAQVKAHIKRAIMQATREMRECGVIRCGNQEYLEQLGICPTAVKVDIIDLLKQEEKEKVSNTSMLNDFLNVCANKYAGAATQQAKWLGFSEEADNKLTYTPES